MKIDILLLISNSWKEENMIFNRGFFSLPQHRTGTRYDNVNVKNMTNELTVEVRKYWDEYILPSTILSRVKILFSGSIFPLLFLSSNLLLFSSSFKNLFVVSNNNLVELQQGI